MNKEELKEKLKKQNPALYPEIFEDNLYLTTPEELKDATVIDIGANIGYFSIFAVLNGAKKTYALEPNLDNFKKLLANCNDFNNITPINLAVSKPELKQANLISDGCGCQLVENGEGYFVNCISLKELLDIIPDNNLILKIDCEGSEYDVIFPTPPEYLKRFKIIYSEIHNKLNPTYDYNMFEKFINDLGFKSETPAIGFGWWCYPGPIFIPFEEQLNKIIKFTRQ